MAGIVYELIEVLEQEKECYEGISTLAGYTETAVVNKNIEFLQEVVKTEETFIGRLSLLEKKRDRLMKDIAIVTGMNFQNITVATIIEKIGKDTEVGQQLGVLREDMRTQLDEIKIKSELNKQLLTDSLELVDFTVNAIGSTRSFSPVGNYSRPGEDGTTQTQQSLFDRKQ